jgi:hypothetical protein
VETASDKSVSRRTAIQAAGIIGAGVVLANRSIAAAEAGMEDTDPDDVKTGVMQKKEGTPLEQFQSDESAAKVLEEANQEKLKGLSKEIDSLTTKLRSLLNAAECLKLPSQDAINEPLSSDWKQVEISNPQPADEEFSHLHVESLLDQAATLLARCITDRSEMDELTAKHVKGILELTEALSLGEILKKEIDAGIFEKDYRQACDQLKSETDRLTRSKVILSIWSTYVKDVLSDAAKKSAKLAHRAMAWFGATQSFVPPNQGGNVAYPRHPYSDKKYGGGDDKGQARTFLRTQAGVLADRSADVQQADADVFKQQEEGRKVDAENKVRSLKRQIGVESKLIDLQTERFRIRDYLLRWQARLTLESGGVLNYGKRVCAIRARIESDLAQAQKRLIQAKRGLLEVFGYTAPPVDGFGINGIDSCLHWTREAVHWLSRFSQKEQAVCAQISLRDLLKGQWDRQVGNLSLEVDIPIFDPSWRHCRLRGISAYVYDGLSVEKRLWSGALKTASEGAITMLDGTRGTVHQDKVPTVHMTRIHERSATRVADIYGMQALHNVSPFGTWKLALKPYVVVPGLDVNASLIKDIILEFSLVYRAAQ